MVLGGCHFININNNQMEDGINVRGCIGEEARPGWIVWGGWLPVVWGGILINKKNREMGGPIGLRWLPFDGGTQQPTKSLH